MYHYSRAIFMSIKDLIDPVPETISAEDARRRVLASCQGTIERLVEDPRYFARPARSLFEEIRHFFPITQQARVFCAVDRVIGLAVEHIRVEHERASDLENRCRATTRKGRPCQRAPLPERDYCPSHQHLERSLAAA